MQFQKPPSPTNKPTAKKKNKKSPPAKSVKKNKKNKKKNQKKNKKKSSKKPVSPPPTQQPIPDMELLNYLTEEEVLLLKTTLLLSPSQEISVQEFGAYLDSAGLLNSLIEQMLSRKEAMQGEVVYGTATPTPLEPQAPDSTSSPTLPPSYVDQQLHLILLDRYPLFLGSLQHPPLLQRPRRMLSLLSVPLLHPRFFRRRLIACTACAAKQTRLVAAQPCGPRPAMDSPRQRILLSYELSWCVFFKSKFANIFCVRCFDKCVGKEYVPQFKTPINQISYLGIQCSTLTLDSCVTSSHMLFNQPLKVNSVAPGCSFVLCSAWDSQGLNALEKSVRP